MALLIDLQGKKGIVVGIANENSIAYGCSRAFRHAGAELAVTYLNEKTKSHVRPLATLLGAPLFLPCNVENDEEIDALFREVFEQWDGLDFLLHSIAYAPKADLHGRLTDSSREGFLQAMDVGCHSFVRLAKRAAPLMEKGGSLLTVSYMGSEEVVPHYGLMGPVKAALESVTRYLAAELGPENIRVNAISPGPIETRAAAGLADFSGLLAGSKAKAPLHRNVSLQDVGNLAAFLVSDLAANITGGLHYVDAGYKVVD